MKEINWKKVLKTYRPILLLWVFVIFRSHLYPYIIPAATPDIFYSGGVYANYEETQIPISWITVLFFHADRCPSCVRAEKNFLASGIPQDLNLIKVDYDDNPELKELYGIRSQTSYAYVNSDWTLIDTRVWSMTVGDILENIEKTK